MTVFPLALHHGCLEFELRLVVFLKPRLVKSYRAQTAR